MAKQRIGALPAPIERTTPGEHDDWRSTATVKTALAGGYCLRAPAQGPCSYANICEHCPSFHTTTNYLPVLTAQRNDAAVLAQDATARGWDAETERHLRLINRLTGLIGEAATRPTAV